MNMIPRIVIVLPLLALACGGSDGGTTSGPGDVADGANGGGDALPCDVADVLAKSCRSCHGETPKFGAPFPLLDRGDLLAPAVSDGSKRVVDLVLDRVRDARRPMPPPPNEQLSDQDIAVLDAWIAAGAPAGTAACEDRGDEPDNPPVLGCTPDVTLRPAVPYKMPREVRDEYICYGVDLEFTQKRHLIGLTPNVDNSRIVHHALLYQAPESFDTTPAPCSERSKGRLLAVWAPGGGALELPPEAGFALEGSTHFVLEVHYSNLTNLDGQEDATGYDLCTTADLRTYDADIFAFGTVDINIPAHGSFDVTCDYKVPEGTPELTVFGAMPHMHTLGTYLSSDAYPGGAGAPMNIGKADPWNFESQVWYEQSLKLRPNDLVRTRCAWANPGNREVTFGEKTLDEMCFNFIMYYPRLDLASWALPAATATCAPTR